MILIFSKSHGSKSHDVSVASNGRRWVVTCSVDGVVGKYLRKARADKVAAAHRQGV